MAVDIEALERRVDYHDNDLYRKPDSITVRLSELEDYKDRSAQDLYHADRGIVPQLTKFFAVLAERERQANKKIARYTVLVAVCAIAAVPIWDVVKHAMGWLK